MTHPPAGPTVEDILRAFAQALDMQGPDDEIEAPAEVMEAFGIQSDESLGIKAEAA